MRRLTRQPSCRAWVVFSDQTDVAWLGWLRPGFRHCFAVLHDGRQWITIDPLLTRLDVQAPHLPAEFDLVDWFARQGLLAVPAPLAAIPASARRPVLRPLTCVEIVKHVLGLRAKWVFTPWQLYRHLVMPPLMPE